ncbi:PP2C family serine/threonine-protein phosphatase [Planktothrix sp. FACHB-1365]|uniref:PP2C family protein-serine/threonine phosphatase n=1 Tax=Planktothrix sp. FACHB-1365 TaxID=2692855 RepID=UPI00168211A5|nr:protein phosphatase 2C domain-containing protein [Planktothrix sp. FACHB-1365]MBD2482859.1 serine/threonine-protein phosphatase [Planktothrix sp. FACHB-1365]
MKRYFAGMTDTGNVRNVNQDAYYIDPDGRFFIVADGMGGHAGGQEASLIASQTIKEYILEHWESSDQSPILLKNAFVAANNAILKDQQKHPERSDMGTTAVVALFREDEENPWFANVGDSRLYRLRGHQLQQITEDQTWVAQAVKRNALTVDEARSHPWRHVLSQCLGREDLSEISIDQMDVKPGDRLLLCSDGLTEELSDTIITVNLKSIRACEAAAKALVKEAKDREGRDNITVIVVAVGSVES